MERTSARARGWLACAVVLTLATGGCAFGDGTQDVEEGYLRAIEIPGYELVQIHHPKATTTGLFLGPPTADLLSAVSGPGLEVSPPTADLSTTHSEYLGRGEGVAEDGTECAAHFRRLRDRIDPPIPDWDPSDEQRRKLAAGELDIVEVSVGCPFDT